MANYPNRNQYFNELPYFVETINFTENFKNSLERYSYFKQFKGPLDSFPTKREKVFYILFVMTRERSTCRKLIELLRENGQTEVANRLEYFNLSKGPMELTMDIKIPILKETSPRKYLSNCYNLVSKPRGKCIIINNFEDQQEPDVYNEKGEFDYKPKGLKRETERFEYIFKELLFEVQVLRNLSAIQMKQELCEIRKDLKRSEAFVVIVISHGENEQVLGYIACDILRKERFGEIIGNANEEAQQLERDVISIKDVIKIFSEKDCPQLKSVPKLYFFNCCRVKSDDSELLKRKKKDDDEFVKVKDPKKLGDGPNLDTFVSYVCSEGFQSFYNEEYGMSYFGQVFTHSISQYACDEPLSEIMSRTSAGLKAMYSDLIFIEQNVEKSGVNPSTLPLGNFAIEVNTYAMDRQLYFNPGIVEFDCISYPQNKSDSTQKLSTDYNNKSSKYSAIKLDYPELLPNLSQKVPEYSKQEPDSNQGATYIKDKTNQCPNESFSNSKKIQMESESSSESSRDKSESNQNNSDSNEGSDEYNDSNQEMSSSNGEEPKDNKKESKSKKESLFKFLSSSKKSRYYLKNGSIYYINDGNFLWTGDFNCPQIVNSNVKFNYLYSMKMQSERSYLIPVAISGKDIYYLNSGSIIKTTHENLLDLCYNKCINNNEIIGNFETNSVELKEGKILKQNEKDNLKVDLNEELINNSTNFSNANLNTPNEINEFLVGKRVVLGKGSFGEVYRYEIKGYISEHATKRIERKDIKSIVDLENEVKMLKICSEEFVVKYYKYWSDPRFFYIEMELCTNSLLKVIEEKAKFFNRGSCTKMGGIEYFILCEIFKEILECVEYLHERNPPIIHRDLKPANILIKEIGNEGRFIKLCDFGLATFGDLLKTISQTPNQGTTKYIAPEVQQGSKYKIHADIYSLHAIAMDMFEYNRHDTGSFITNDERFKEPSTKLENIIKDMARTDNFRERPECRTIIAKYDNWKIDLKQFIGTDEYNEILFHKNIELYNFFVNFFQAKRALNRSR